ISCLYQAEDGIRDWSVTGVQTCALPISELLSRRLGVSRREKDPIRLAIRNLIWENFPKLRQGCVGFYWPFKGEIDLRHLVRDLQIGRASCRERGGMWVVAV